MNKLLLATAAAFLLAACDQAQETPEELQLVSGISLENMDLSVRPQDDFYLYVNGKWLAETEIPGDKTSWGGFAILRDESEHNQRTIVEALAQRTDLEPGNEAQKVGDMFASFMDVEAINALGAAPVQPFLDRLAAVGNKVDFITFTAEMSEYSIDAPLGLTIFGDLGDSSRYMTYVFQGGLGLPDRDYYLKHDEKYDVMRAAYPQYLVRLYELAGLDYDSATAAEVLVFETALAEIQWPSQEMRNIPRLYNLFEVAEVGVKVTDYVDWTAFLAAAHLENITEIVIAQPDYTQALVDLIEATPLETLKAYYAGAILNGSAASLSQDFVNASQDFNGAIVSGRRELPPRWQRGVRLVNNQIGYAVGKVYVEEFFPPEAKVRMEQLVQNLFAAFEQSIDELEWMGDETKAMAQDKRSRMMTKIGYPDVWRDYSNLTIARGDLFGNVMRANQFEHMRNVKQLAGPVDRTEWGMTPQTVNAYHNPVLNEIVFPAAILQPPFFNMAAEDAVNYGAIGAVIGHEIGHAFDDNGRLFDGSGTLNEWWSEEDAAAFEAAAAALVEQYSQFEALPGLTVNGQLTLGENIGDLTGLTIGWLAYVNSLDGKEPPVIDGFTGAERYLIGFAQIWRNKSTEQAMRRLVVGNPHSPPEFRANGTLMNSPLFMRVYKIQPGDRMFRPEEDRVKIW